MGALVTCPTLGVATLWPSACLFGCLPGGTGTARPPTRRARFLEVRPRRTNPSVRITRPTILACSLSSSGAGNWYFWGGTRQAVIRASSMGFPGTAATPAATKTGCRTALLVAFLVLTSLQVLPLGMDTWILIVVFSAHQWGCLDASWWVVVRGQGESPLCA